MKHDSLASDFSNNSESPQVGFAGKNGAQGASTQLPEPRHSVENTARKVNNLEIDNEEFRLRELARYRILDTLPEQAYDDIVALAAHICDAPIALISLVDDHRQWFKSKHGIDASETDRAHAFCAHAIAQPDTLVVHDPLSDPRFATNPLVIGALGIRFYAGAQLITQSGAALGTLCVIDQAPRAFTAEQQLALETLARQVMTHLELRLQAMELQAIIAERDQQRRVLQTKEQRLELTLEASQAGIWDWDITNKTVVFSDRWKALFGYAPHEIGDDESEWLIRIHPEDHDLVSSWVRNEFARPGVPAHSEYRMLHKDGRVIWVAVRAIAVHDDNGNPYRAVGSVLDVTDRRRIDEELFEAKERAEITLQSIGDAVVTTDIDGIIESLNPVAERLIGYAAAEAIGRGFESVFKIVNEETREPVENPLAACLRTGAIVALDSPTVLIRADGSELSIDDSAAPIRTADGGVVGAVLVFRDVTEERRLVESVSHQATHDTLTDLANRREFERRLELMLKSSVERDAEHGLCYIDLDQFKVINDTCGHAAGDALLTQLSNMLKTKIRERDTLARLGGDEFGLLLGNCSLNRAASIATKLKDAIAEFRFSWDSNVFRIGASIGVTPITKNSGDIATLLSAADSACYAAKEAGRNQVRVFDTGDNELAELHGEMRWVHRLQDAITEDRLLLYRQDIVPLDLDSDEPKHYELLLRLVDRDGTVHGPGAFLPAAERYGEMGKVDRWVFDQTCSIVAATSDHDNFVYNVNLSGQSLSDSTFLDYIVSRIRESQIDATRVCFEITESAAISNLHAAQNFISSLREAGCTFALDDFGSGLSSFGYLKNLHVDQIKIDGSFVRDMTADPIDYAMVEAIHRIAKLMNIKTVAEHVEDKATLDALIELGIDYAQGYYLSRPGPTPEILSTRQDVSN